MATTSTRTDTATARPRRWLSVLVHAAALGPSCAHHRQLLGNPVIARHISSHDRTCAPHQVRVGVVHHFERSVIAWCGFVRAPSHVGGRCRSALLRPQHLQYFADPRLRSSSASDPQVHRARSTRRGLRTPYSTLELLGRSRQSGADRTHPRSVHEVRNGPLAAFPPHRATSPIGPVCVRCRRSVAPVGL